MKRFKSALVTLCVLILLAPVLWGGTVALLETWGRQISRSYIDAAGDGTEDEKILKIAKVYHEIYLRSLATPPTTSQMILHRLRGYASSQFLPPLLRVDPGAIELAILTGTGACGNASRALAFVYQTMGYDARQINIVSPRQHHAALMLRSGDGREMLVDPSFGFVPTRAGRILGPREYRQALQSNDTSVQSVLFSEQASDAWYRKDFPVASYAYQGATHVVRARVDVPDEGIVFGALDGRSEDIDTATSQMGATQYWGYLGHRYDRGYIREFSFDRSVTVDFHLAKPASPKFATANIRPTITGKHVIFEVPEGQALVFHDGKAPRDFLTLRSYQVVDRVKISPSGTKSTH